MYAAQMAIPTPTLNQIPAKGLLLPLVRYMKVPLATKASSLAKAKNNLLEAVQAVRAAAH